MQHIPTRSPLTVAICAVLALAAVCSLDAVIGLQTVIANQSDSHANIIGFGALFAAIGLTLVGTWRYFEAGILLGILGIPVVVAGYGFFGGGVAQLLLPHLNYLSVWGMNMAIIAVAALLIWMLNLMLANMPAPNKSSRAPRVMRTGVEQVFFTRDCQDMFVPFMMGASAVILLSGLLT
jgi:hypothetical protein